MRSVPTNVLKHDTHVTLLMSELCTAQEEGAKEPSQAKHQSSKLHCGSLLWKYNMTKMASISDK